MFLYFTYPFGMTDVKLESTNQSELALAFKRSTLIAKLGTLLALN
jgi:hypothetical protein